MLNERLKKKILFGSTMLAGFAAVAVNVAPAYAQTSPAAGAPTQTAPDPAAAVPNSDDANEVAGDQAADQDVQDDPGEVEAVIVTGSRIRRDPTNAPAPLIQVNREQFLQSGEANIIDFLADVPALQTSFTPEDQTTGGLGVGGLSALNLRNLGTTRTLVLVDGRRHVGSTLGGLTVDVDTIPTLLIENVEIVTGGQSALYGTDAVSGVVNFILRRNFEGVEIDGGLNQVNQDGQLSGRLSGLVGRNFLNDRLNLYAFGEYQKNEAVLNLDIDYLREANFFLNVDSDPAVNQPDSELDNILIRGARDAFFARGGVLVLSNQVRPSTGFLPGTSTVADPDLTIQNCGAVPTLVQRRTTLLSTNCSNVVPDQPGKVFTFNADGTARAFNFGSFQDQNGNSRRINVGGDGLNPNTEFGQGLRLPEQENYRFQTGMNFDITENIQLFGEAKYARDETLLVGQPTFFQLTLQDIPANTQGVIIGTSGNNNVYGLDNAFLDPNLRAAIQANTRPAFDLCPTGRQSATAAITTVSCVGTGPNPFFGTQIGTVADPRAFLGVFGPSRPQFNERDLQRYVVGLRGDMDRLGFIQNFSWEAGYTHGEVENVNVEQAVDSERFFFATDAVRNASGQIVCRVQDLAARGVPILNQNPFRTGTNISATDPIVTGCVPTNIFGSDFRADAGEENITGGGGRPGFTAAQREYVTATVSITERNEQDDFLAFASGELFDLWGAGPIGMALGYEYRKEGFSGLGRENNRGDRLLFLNNSNNNPGNSYQSNEVFGEVRIPLLRDLPFAESAEISGAYRIAENSVESIGTVDTYSLQTQWRPTRDVLFRATYGKAVRIPTLSNLFNTGFGTFSLLTDPCDATNLKNQADPIVRANRRANCIALLGPGYDPDQTQIIYQSSVAGAGGAGNPLLKAEESRSYTASIVLTPRFAPRLSLVLDFYDIALTDAIQTVTAQVNLNNCFSGQVANQAACNLFVRNGANPGGSGQNAQPFGLTFFNQGAQNYAATEAKGFDFNARYSLDIADFIQRDLGRIDYSLRGNYLIRQEDFDNINDPGDATENDSLTGQPRVRFVSTVTYSPRPNLSLTWDWDWQSSQEIRDSDLLIQDPDNREPRFLETGSFTQHDFAVRYELRDVLTLRAGVINAFDAEPELHVQGGPVDTRGFDVFNASEFDLFGRRFYVGFNYRR